MRRLWKFLIVGTMVCAFVSGFSPLNLSGSPFELQIAIAAVDPYAGKDQAFLTQEADSAIDTINQFRIFLGVQTVKKNSSLSKAAQAHSNYCAANNVQSHFETQVKPGFTGVYPWDRAQYYGYGSSSLGEVISWSWVNHASIDIDGLIDAPYHRLILADPNCQDVGIGFNHTNGSTYGNTSANLGTTNCQNNIGVVLYPYSGQKNAKTTWYDYEAPNPLESYNKPIGSKVGYPISVSLYDFNALELKTTSATLVDSKGNAVPFYQVDSSRESDEGEKLHLFLIPQQPLQAGTSYSVDVKADIIYIDGTVSYMEKKWSFSTLN